MIDVLLSAAENDKESAEHIWDLIKTLAPIIITVVVGGIFTIVSSKSQKKGERENQMIDQLQEEMDRKNEEQKEMKSDIISLQNQVNELFYKSHEDEEYIVMLRNHILKGSPPPPPERKTK